MTKFLSAVFLFTMMAAAFSGCSTQKGPGNNSTPTTVSAEPTPDKVAIEAQLKAMEYDWPRILKERDGAAVRKLEADDIMIVSPDGSDGSKEADIRDIESGQMADDPEEVTDVVVNVIDTDSAIVRSRTVVKSDNHVLSDGKCQTVIHEFRTIDTFARRNSQWQIVASATGPVIKSSPTANQSPTQSESTSSKPSPASKSSPASSGSPQN